jgi:hypothetical protein
VAGGGQLCLICLLSCCFSLFWGAGSLFCLWCASRMLVFLSRLRTIYCFGSAIY